MHHDDGGGDDDDCRPEGSTPQEATGDPRGLPDSGVWMREIMMMIWQGHDDDDDKVMMMIMIRRTHLVADDIDAPTSSQIPESDGFILTAAVHRGWGWNKNMLFLDLVKIDIVMEMAMIVKFTIG